MDDLDWTAGVLDGTIETYGATGRRRAGGRRGGRGNRGRRRHSSRGRRQQGGDSTEDITHRALRAPLAVYDEMAAGDPVVHMKLQNLELLCKSESLMAWGAGRHYDRCVFLLSLPKLARSLSRSDIFAERNSRTLDTASCVAEPTSATNLAYELGESPAERTQPPYRCIKFTFPRFDMVQDSGECAAWFSGLFVFIETLMANRKENLSLERVTIRLPGLPEEAHVPAPMNDVFVQGMTRLFQKLISLGEIIAKSPGGSFVVEFDVYDDAPSQPLLGLVGGYEEFQGLWTQAFDGRVRGQISLSSSQKVAFLMGLHERLGASSPVNMLNRDTAELVLRQVERQRLEVVWKPLHFVEE